MGKRPDILTSLVSKLKQAAKEQRIMLCLIDSDKDYCSAAHGSTYKGANSVYKKIKNNHIVYMTGTKIISNLDLKEFTISVTKEKKCSPESKQIYTSEKFDLYKYCLTDVIVTFPDGQYEIESALSSNKLYIPDLPIGAKKKEESKTDNTAIYRFEDYSILVCDNEISNKIFIGPKKMKINAVECQISEEE